MAKKTADVVLKDILTRVCAIEADRAKLRADLEAVLSGLVTLSQAQDVKIQALGERVQDLIIIAEKRRQRPDTGQLMDATAKTGRLISKYWNDDELIELCIDFHIEHENLDGETTRAKARELAQFLARRGELGSLIRRCVELRPRAYGWPIEMIERY